MKLSAKRIPHLKPTINIEEIVDGSLVSSLGTFFFDKIVEPETRFVENKHCPVLWPGILTN